MKKYLFLTAVAAMSLASCQSDDVVDIKQDEIKFNVVADNSSRAVDIYCNNNLPEDFKVWAYWINENDEHVMYIDGDIVKKNGTTYASDNVRYWPEDKSLNFIAFKNLDKIGLNSNNHVQYFNDNGDSLIIIINPNVAEQVDMLYAITNNQTKAANASTGVNLNFRHLLSQIVFNAKNTNENNLQIEVSGVKVGNAIESACAHFPFLSDDGTTGNFEDHEGNSDYTFNPILFMANGEGGIADYVVDFTSVKLGATTTALTSANAEGKEFSNTAMLLLPQSTAAWDPTTSTTPDGTNSGAYIAVNCKITNIAKGDGTATESDVVLHDGWAYIPVAFDWKAGKKYTYTFIFGNGNGGYDDDGDVVLAPVSYNVTVDDFGNAGNIDQEMTTL